MLDEFADVRQTPAPRRRWGRRILAILLGLLLLLTASVAAYLIYLNQTVEGNVKHEPLLPGQAVTAPGSPARTDLGENYLIIGSDARPGDTASRSDVIILAHIPQDKKQVYLVHFPRDLYVTIPGRGKDKINHSYAYGGAPLLVSTMQDLLGITIDHVAKTDFDGFVKMTDAVGGVRVYAEEASPGVAKGWNDLDGKHALAFVRERYHLSEGDISRGKRQLAWIKALMTKALSAETMTNPITLARFTDAATSNLIVDEGLTVAKMRSEALSLRSVRGKDIIFSTAPFSGFGTGPGGMSIDIVDEPGMQRLGDALRNDTMSTYADINVQP